MCVYVVRVKSERVTYECCLAVLCSLPFGTKKQKQKTIQRVVVSFFSPFVLCFFFSSSFSLSFILSVCLCWRLDVGGYLTISMCCAVRLSRIYYILISNKCNAHSFLFLLHRHKYH